MGQCIGRPNWIHRRRRSRQYRHKRFDFTPKKTWKFQDSAILNQFQQMSLRNEAVTDDPTEPLPVSATPTTVNGHGIVSSSRYEGKRGSRLVFEDERDSTLGSLDGTTISMETDDQSAETGTEQKKFEVAGMDEEDLFESVETESAGTAESTDLETSKLLDIT